jgi:2-polyprenyl-3-methyl-5-hydroxy-6-metoxy-1,4-benzoquinol methylase
MKRNLDKHVAAYQGSTIYDFDNEVLLTWYASRIVALAGRAESLLELGLGHGHTARIFSSHFKEHAILDGSAAVIENFKVRNPECQARITQSLFEDYEGREEYDIVVLGFVLEHVDDPVFVIRRFMRNVRPGGRMYIAVPNAKVLNRRLGHLAGMLPDIHKLSENDLLLGHRRYYTMESLISDITKAGCEIERTEGIYLKPFTTAQMLSLHLDRKVITALCKVGTQYPELCCGIMVGIAR